MPIGEESAGLAVALFTRGEVRLIAFADGNFEKLHYYLVDEEVSRQGSRQKARHLEACEYPYVVFLDR
jgi:hypothetical protein